MSKVQAYGSEGFRINLHALAIRSRKCNRLLFLVSCRKGSAQQDKQVRVM